ncbi:MAG: NAD(P)/FAD-dependent oxidoreductase [Bacilli bacterium]|nr:NAD(P)/FAD-dependent oxidoreductase [Bacilli bacterium]
MKKYDIIIVGAGSAGSYFARKMAVLGFEVLVIEKLSETKVGTKYDIFHIVKEDFSTFGLPLPEKGNDFAFEFSKNANYSAYGNYPKRGGREVIGLHLHKYTLRLNRWAESAGAVIKYNAEFKRLLYNDGKISGLVYLENGKEVAVQSRLVADCSGIKAVIRTSLPDDYGIENFEVQPDEMFYVTLRYVEYLDSKDYLKHNRSWPFYKTWEAPQINPKGAIIGIGANLSYEYGEKIFEVFSSVIELPKYKLEHIEKGVTPYRRPPYSFVSDNLVIMGDAACLTKPHNGEGVASSMVQADIAIAHLGNLLKEGKDLTRENLWQINKNYIETQGKAFASLLASLAGAVNTNAKENDFFFKKDIIFSEKTFEGMGDNQDIKFSFGELLKMAFIMLGGVLSGKLRIKTIRSLLKAMKNGEKIGKLYSKYPDTSDGYLAWVRKADSLWEKCGSMADALKQKK